jgi:hypothetical protein
MKRNFSSFCSDTDLEITLFVVDGLMKSRLVCATLTGKEMSEPSRGSVIFLRKAMCFSTVIELSYKGAHNCNSDSQNHKMEEHYNV